MDMKILYENISMERNLNKVIR